MTVDSYGASMPVAAGPSITTLLRGTVSLYWSRPRSGLKPASASACTASAYDMW